MIKNIQNAKAATMQRSVKILLKKMNGKVNKEREFYLTTKSFPRNKRASNHWTIYMKNKNKCEVFTKNNSALNLIMLIFSWKKIILSDLVMLKNWSNLKTT